MKDYLVVDSAESLRLHSERTLRVVLEAVGKVSVDNRRQAGHQAPVLLLVRASERFVEEAEAAVVHLVLRK